MMRYLLLIPLSLALVAAGGVAICAALHLNAHPRELTLACGAMFAAGAIGALPVFLARHAQQLAMSQAALVGTMAHLIVAAAVVGIPIMGHFGLDRAFL